MFSKFMCSNRLVYQLCTEEANERFVLDFSVKSFVLLIYLIWL